MFATVGSVAPHLKSGRLKALAVTSAQPTSLAPFADGGVSGAARLRIDIDLRRIRSVEDASGAREAPERGDRAGARQGGREGEIPPERCRGGGQLAGATGGNHEIRDRQDGQVKEAGIREE